LSHQQPWAVILAGGDGIRLRALTQFLSGEDRPKQYCALHGSQTLLAQTRSRLAQAIHPERTVMVVVKAHEKFYSRQLADVDPRRLVVQPANKGTTAAVICSLLRITTLDGDPVVAFFPTDHHYSNEAGFVASVHRAVRVAQHHSDTLVVLGADPEHAEVDYGWIEPGMRFESRFTKALLRVSRFWEKPSHPTAEALLAQGCLWNTFVMIGRASIFLEMLDKTSPPGMLSAFTAARRHASSGAYAAGQDQLWATLVPGDFSRQVLSTSTENLAVLRMGNVGWSDLGTPERVKAAIARSGLKAPWQESAQNENYKELAKTSAI
jgi:mannose-1-phosphate guanylyltransferase